MKKIILSSLLISLIMISCGNDNKLNKAEEESVESQILKDDAAMDSLEKVIQSQLDSAALLLDSIEE